MPHTPDSPIPPDVQDFAVRAGRLWGYIEHLVRPDYRPFLHQIACELLDLYSEWLTEQTLSAQAGVIAAVTSLPPHFRETADANAAASEPDTTTPAFDAAHAALTPEQAERLAAISDELRELLIVPRQDAYQELLNTHRAIVQMAADEHSTRQVETLLSKYTALAAYFYVADPRPFVPGSDRPC